MKFTYINENKGFINKKDIVRNEDYNIHDIVLDMLEVHTARDFINFISKAPYSFFSKFFFDMHEEERIDDILPDDTRYSFKGSIEDAVQKYFLDIDYLDEFIIREGVLGPTFKKRSKYRPNETEEVIQSNGYYEFVYLSSIDNFVRNAQKLLYYVAVASQDKIKGFLKREPIQMNTGAQIVKSGLIVYSDLNSARKEDSALSCIFNKSEIETIAKAVEPLGYEVYDLEIHNRYSNLDKPFVVRESMGDSKVAAFIFTWFMNTLFEGNYEAYYSNNTFKVEFENGRFKLRKARNPIQEFYCEIAKLAESGSIKLCANCKRAFIDNKSRGTKALYCSRSCNTLASNKRKRLARKYKDAGIPVEKAIQKIGLKYEKSIRDWYSEKE